MSFAECNFAHSAIEILATEKDLTALGANKNRSPTRGGRRGPPSSSALLSSQSLSQIFGKREAPHHAEPDESFKIQTMAVEMGKNAYLGLYTVLLRDSRVVLMLIVTCPDCLQQVELKTFKL